MAERILLVDDHPLTRSALSALLQQHGFDVVGEAADGAEAIHAAGRLHPDLVLLDLSMPGLDGLTALPRLREAAPDCEVVVLTASGTEENLLGAIRAGVDAIGTASEEAIMRAMRMTWERMKIVIEPSAAVPLACLLERSLDVQDAAVGIILSGGNVDLERLPWQV